MTENGTPLTTVEEGAEFELLNTEDRSAFVLRFKTDGLTAHLAGEDAARFRADYETIQRNIRPGRRTRRSPSYGTRAATAGSPRRTADKGSPDDDAHQDRPKDGRKLEVIGLAILSRR